MQRTCWWSVLALAISPAAAWAQYGVTSSGTFGSRTVGGSTGYSSTTTGNAALQQAGQGTLGQSTTGGLGGATGGATTNSAALGGTERFLRENRGNAFVGADSTDSRSLVNQSQTNGQTGAAGGQLGNAFGSQFGRGQGGGLDQLFSAFGRNGQNLGQFGSQQAKPIRTPLKIGFTPKPVATSAFTARFQQRLSKIPALSTLGPIRAVMEGETLVLQGTAATEADRQLAEDLAELEPEVTTVRNEIVVPSAGPTEPAAAPTTASPGSGR